MDWATNWTGVQRGPSLKKQEAGVGWGWGDTSTEGEGSNNNKNRTQLL